MRFVFFDNDTRMIFATTFDGDRIHISTRGSSPQAKDDVAKHQITAEAGTSQTPDLTVAETRRLTRIGEAVKDCRTNSRD